MKCWFGFAIDNIAVAVVAAPVPSDLVAVGLLFLLLENA